MDILERLRKTWPEIQAGPVTSEQRRTVSEAADEIERLRRENHDLAMWQKVAAKDNAAIDAYLRGIKTDLPSHYGMPSDGVRIVVTWLVCHELGMIE